MFLASVTALWIGILTSISPCPLATNIAAISFVAYRVSNRMIVLLSGLFYSIGRSITYAVIGFLVVAAFVSVPSVSNFLQTYINKILGPLLILVGMFLLDLLKLKIHGISVSNKTVEKLDRTGLIGSLLLGILFALAFCPVSAALFFGSLIPLAIKAESSIVLPTIFGIGTALPVLFFAVLVVLGSSYVDKFYNRIGRIEYYTKRITGVLFIFVGVYYVFAYIFELF